MDAYKTGASQPQGYYNQAAQPGHVVVSVGDAPGYTPWRWCHFVTSVFGFFCCQPFGLIGLVMSLLSYTDHKSKDYARAQSKRSCGLGFAIAAIVIGSISFLIFIIAYSILIKSAVDSINSGNPYYHG